MAKRRKRVGEMDTTTMVLLGLGGVGVLFLLMNANKSATPPVIVRTTTPTNSGAVTAAEIAAGAGVLTTALNDFSSDD